MVERMVPAIYVEDLVKSKDFYCDLFGFTPTFEADWIVQLSDPNHAWIALMLQPRTHDLIPAAFQKPPQGSSLAFVVSDCDAYYENALSMGLQIVQQPQNESYGQRRFLTVDPDGLLIDVSSNCEPSPEFMAQYFGSENG